MTNYSEREKRIIELARQRYAIPSHDDLEIDDNPKLSEAEGGTWVAAWVWVDNERLGEESE